MVSIKSSISVKGLSIVKNGQKFREMWTVVRRSRCAFLPCRMHKSKRAWYSWVIKFVVGLCSCPKNTARSRMSLEARGWIIVCNLVGRFADNAGTSDDTNVPSMLLGWVELLRQ